MPLIDYCVNLSLPDARKPVYKEECLYSFDTPENCSEGLFISLESFLAVGKDFLTKFFHKTSQPLFLNYKRIKKSKSPINSSDVAPTKLGIGIEGGFSAGKETEFEFEDSYRVYLLPEDKYFDTEDDVLPEVVRQNVKYVRESHSARASSLPLEWDGEKRKVTQVVLEQPPTEKKIPLPDCFSIHGGGKYRSAAASLGWKCERCDLTTNLWINLTDGAILCGRKFFDGSGGNNHAVDYYKETGYPLAVKLGTITADGKGDVFSYPEDDMVDDPHLAEHLKHFGINVANLVKTDKTVAEMELELNQSYEWKLLTGSGNDLERLYGEDYTGIRNLGNTCYIASVMQVLYHIPSISSLYKNAFPSFCDTLNPLSIDIHNNVSFQTSKLFHGLQTGTYSTVEKSEAFIEGISPLSFKRCVGRNHVEFSTANQQDAQEFMLHFFSLVEKNSLLFGEDFTKQFQFTIQEKIVCEVSKAVRYDSRKDNMLSLFVPMDKAINLDEVKKFEELKVQLKLEGKDPDLSQVVIPKVPFSALLTSFSDRQAIENFRSPAVGNSLVQASKFTSMTTFPKYLVVHIRRFAVSEDWRPTKLEVSIDMPQLIDLSSLRSIPKSENEVMMPETSGTPEFEFKDEILSGLTTMGFSLDASKRACYNSNNTGVDQALDWLMLHLEDPDLNTPFILPNSASANQKQPSAAVASEDSIALVMSMGFERIQAANALKNTNNDVERAIDWIFNHLEESMIPEQPTSPSSQQNSGRLPTGGSRQVEIDMGPAKYKLLSFVSHMGPSASCGHYVSHVKINDRWVLFNDEKVAVSSNVPRDLGYLYFYERVGNSD